MQEFRSLHQIYLAYNTCISLVEPTWISKKSNNTTVRTRESTVCGNKWIEHNSIIKLLNLHVVGISLSYKYIILVVAT